MDQELRAYLAAMESRLMARIDEAQQASEARLMARLNDAQEAILERFRLNEAVLSELTEVSRSNNTIMATITTVARADRGQQQ